MRRFGGVDEEGGRAGGGQRRGDLAADMAALAHAHDGDAAAAGQHGLHGVHESVAQAWCQFGKGAGFNLERLAADADGSLGGKD